MSNKLEKDQGENYLEFSTNEGMDNIGFQEGILDSSIYCFTSEVGSIEINKAQTRELYEYMKAYYETRGHKT